MPAVTSGKVLVTGASGFLGAWVSRVLLEKGFSVRGTVRSNSKGDYLKKLFASHGEGKFEYSIVKDIEAPGAFDEAVKGVVAVEHTASPFHFDAEDPQALIGPAVNGTVGILNSILKNGSSVQRVVVTSSIAAAINPVTKPTVFTEKDWNKASPKEVETKGKKASAFDKYLASKTLAEQAAWNFVEEHKADITWDLVTILPPYIFGPIIHEVHSYESLNTSTLDLYTTVKGERAPEDLAKPISSFADVRDIASAHYLAITVQAAGGQRFIPSNGEYTWQDFLDALADSGLPNIPKGTPGAGKSVVHPAQFSNETAVKVLGVKFHTIQETAKDTVVSVREHGW
ncbi:NAD(P)-binding protein [Sistotremastrum niveocremeum HHB9708]|uniref:NAD(P)-binding protein n=2 Tax=Sistotremastraceae TaxID=3402574 RepID=A0A164R0A6_9AGAM|nr:NAD(P)-binding protein [Sistotremastrum niveocremeum HHB9708]KZT38288.1 NAD(P)-binding protein [Sistotremastrum suecicum HHB10207 ss-3]